MNSTRKDKTDPLADPDTGKRIVFPKVRMRLTYEDVMGQHAPILGPGSPDYVMASSRRRLPKAADQNELHR